MKDAGIKSPLYLISPTESNRQFALNIKDSAMALQNSISMMQDRDSDDALMNSRKAVASNPNIDCTIIEENKADMVSLAMLDVLTEAGMYTPEQRKQIIVTYATDNMMMSKPTLSQAHRDRSGMQNYYFIKEGAITISPDGILDINMDKMVPTAKKMLEEIIRVQLSGDFATGEKYVLDNFIWTPEMDKMAENIKSVSKTLNGKVESPLADELLKA